MSVLKVLTELCVYRFKDVEVVFVDSSNITIQRTPKMYLILLEYLPILFCQ